MAAERAAYVAFRIAARRTVHHGLAEVRHRLIVAASRPGAKGRSLTAAIVAVGVGIALAKAERDRRAGAARIRRERSPSLADGEPLGPGLQRVMLGQLDLAIELLEDYPGATDRSEIGQHTVHELRKALKRLRALLRLLRHRLGPKRYARESAALRDCARRLAGARDAEVMVGTLDALLERHPKRLARSRGCELRAQLPGRANRPPRGRFGTRSRRVAADELRAVRRRVAGWELSGQWPKLVEPGLERLYRQGRRNLRTARRRADIEALHRLRKRVKDLRYAAETLDRPSKRMRRLARRADRLGEMLGEEHDLALLARAVRGSRGHFAGEQKARRYLRKLIARRRSELRRRGLREGERLYRRRPQRFVRRLRGR
jgi:CHAD domain-containing protein